MNTIFPFRKKRPLLHHHHHQMLLCYYHTHTFSALLIACIFGMYLESASFCSIQRCVKCKRIMDDKSIKIKIYQEKTRGHHIKKEAGEKAKKGFFPTCIHILFTSWWQTHGERGSPLVTQSRCILVCTSIFFFLRELRVTFLEETKITTSYMCEILFGIPCRFRFCSRIRDKPRQRTNKKI